LLNALALRHDVKEVQKITHCKNGHNNNLEISIRGYAESASLFGGGFCLRGE